MEDKLKDLDPIARAIYDILKKNADKDGKGRIQIATLLKELEAQGYVPTEEELMMSLNTDLGIEYGISKE